jgi:cell wall-associated NlpC family hydrolase
MDGRSQEEGGREESRAEIVQPPGVIPNDPQIWGTCFFAGSHTDTVRSGPNGCPVNARIRPSRRNTCVTFATALNSIRMLSMLFSQKSVIAGLTLCLCGAPISLPAQSGESSGTVRRVQMSRENAAHTLSRNDGLEVVTVALDERVRMGRRRDCSHLVHAIYEQAGFSYPYASSTDLYRGTEDFHRVKRPQPGDLVVWRGHVGIVVNPRRREFYSFLRHGPGIDEYDAQYWKQRGPVRFYRYIKGESHDDDSAPE